MLTKNFRPDPLVEEPKISFAGPVQISCWKKQGLLTFEAIGFRDGERRVVRSFTLRATDLVRSPAVIKLLRQALDDVEEMEVDDEA